MLNEKTEEYILENMNLVRYMASRYFTKNIGIEYEDLVSYGTMGLIEAANSFHQQQSYQMIQLHFQHTLVLK